MAADFIETSRLFARTTALIDEQWLETLGKELCKYNYSDPHWSKKSGQVQALERVSLFGLPIVAGRKVNYGRINEKTAAEAREIFIHQGLIGGELSGRYPFLQHNLTLIQEISTMEERVRRRNLLVDDQVLFAFYKERIGSAYDKFTLNRLLKNKRSDTFLWMNEQDICREMPGQDELYLYPKTLRAGEFELPLHYHFQPGDEKDGVTVSLTPQQISSLSPAPFEWLVPGLLDEKILYLFKRLPKKLRRRLVPLPDAVDRIMDRLDLYSGSLYPALEKALLREFQLIVTRGDWQTDTLPRHLLMRYQLKGENTKILRTSRSFTEIVASLSDLPEGGSRHPVRQSRKKIDLPTRNGLTTWDFKDLPARISVPTGTGADKLYFPALSVNDQGQVDLRYIENEREARLQNRHGMEVLYCLQFPGCRKQIRKECKTALGTHSASWLSLGMKGTALELREALLQFVMDALFDTRNGLIPDESHFNEIIAELGKQGIHRKVQATLGNLIENIALRRRVTADLIAWTNRCRKNKSYNKAIAQDFIQCLENILPSDFLVTRSNEQMLHTGRYLQALAIRLQRAEQEPAKDAKKQQRLTTAVNRLAHIGEFSTHNPECRKAIALYRTMVEEFRVSVFAPEVGTALPVSEKRLKILWQELENTCRQVE